MSEEDDGDGDCYGDMSRILYHLSENFLRISKTIFIFCCRHSGTQIVF